MNLTPLIAQLVAQSLQRPRQRARAVKGELVCYAFAGLLVLAGAVFFLGALYAELRVYYPAPVAALVSGFASWFAAILLVLSVRVLKKDVSAPSESPEDVIEDKLADIIERAEETLGAVTRQLKEPVRENPAMSMLLASLAGFVAARQLR